MADIRFVRPQCDNKIRNFTPLPRTQETIHITTPTPSHPSSWELFVTSKPIRGDASQIGVSPSQHSTKNTGGYNIGLSNSNKDEQKPADGDEISLCHHTNRSSPLLSNTTFNSEGNEEIPPWTTQQRITSEARAIPENKRSPSSLQTLQSNCSSCHMSSPSDSRKDMTMSVRKCPVMTFYTSFGSSVNAAQGETRLSSSSSSSSTDSFPTAERRSSGDSNLLDIRDEELDELPEVKNPAGVFSPTREPDFPSPCKAGDEDTTENQSHCEQPAASTKNIKSSVDPPRTRSIFKRGVSSLTFEETQYRSFFSSLRKKDADYYTEEDEDPDDHDIPISPLWNLRRPWIFNSFHRSHSADSIVQTAKRKKQSRMSGAHSLTPVERIGADDEESEEEENNCHDRWIRDSNEIGDRMKMRRGALAQPERMIMSQAVREKVQRDVARRKTSMVRRVSQFFNVQLGLNREEDLI